MSSDVASEVYRTGRFFRASHGGEDALFKVQALGELLERNHDVMGPISRVADIGCGTGDATRLIRDSFFAANSQPPTVVGFDLHPGVERLECAEGLSFIRGDFRQSAHAEFDLGVVLDVLEHVLQPEQFAAQVGARVRWVVFHIPLEDCVWIGMRNLFRGKLRFPAHVSFFDTASALNLLASAGILVEDYLYTPVFMAPTGRRSMLQRVGLPLRWLIFRISPWLLQKTLGGVSLLVLGRKGV